MEVEEKNLWLGLPTLDVTSLDTAKQAGTARRQLMICVSIHRS